MNDRPVLLFDLGGVLVENTMFEDLPNLMGEAKAGDLHELWLSSPAVQSFERGGIDPDAFARAFIAEWKLPTSPQAFLERFAAWPRGFFPGAGALLTALRADYRIVYLSNSNALHWARFGDILAHADAAFASHLCGLVKPDPAIFEFVVERLGRDPADIHFFDDSATNVAAARRIGLQAHRTVGLEALSKTLIAQGFMPAESGPFA
ncbi:MAG: HAD-IA family hydrolase [Caulobacteraceae bacterium]|nr:HAD-IA family hydrolase [Caulobacteraceae bacterium]